ncbi:MAG: response regulator transcription factor [Bacteroidales bacterium]|nr:response regulator transcription factor [Bacteroidales bacterium]
MYKILLIEDEHGMAEGIKDALDLHGFKVTHAGNAEIGEDLLETETFDLVLLDVMLPGRDGFEMCRLIRAKGLNLPVVMLTARNEEVDKVVGLEIGADDYVSKPFSMRELIARIKALLRRAHSNKQIPDMFSFGNVRVDFKTHKVFCSEEPVILTGTEFAILKLLIEERPNVISRDKILNEIWGYTFCPDSRIVDTHILNIRKKLECEPRNPEYIKTHHGIGYRFTG